MCNGFGFGSRHLYRGSDPYQFRNGNPLIPIDMPTAFTTGAKVALEGVTARTLLISRQIHLHGFTFCIDSVVFRISYAPTFSARRLMNSR